jgi:hypothetical protein
MGMSYLSGGQVPPPTPNAAPISGNGYGAPQPGGDFFSSLAQIMNKTAQVKQAQQQGQIGGGSGGGPENTAAANSARGGLSALSGALGGGAGGAAGGGGMLSALGGF